MFDVFALLKLLKTTNMMRIGHQKFGKIIQTISSKRKFSQNTQDFVLYNAIVCPFGGRSWLALGID